MVKKAGIIVLLVALAAVIIQFTACKSCNKTEETTTPAADTTQATGFNNIVLPPHGDTTIIPLVSQVLDSALNFSGKKDYSGLASLLVYRGEDATRVGTDVYTTKTKYEKDVVKITAEVMNKWNSGAENREYIRIFEVPTMNGEPMQMLEVIFAAKKEFNRKFFGFIKVKGNYRIAEVISSLEGYN